jgi:hypothetical protein
VLSENKIIFSLNGKIGYFDKFGNVDISPIYEVYPNFLKEGTFKNNLAKVKFKGKYGLIDDLGKWIIQAQHQKLGEPSKFVPFYKDLLWGFLDFQNKIIIPPTYEEVKCFDNELALVNLSDRYGVIDFNGK